MKQILELQPITFKEAAQTQGFNFIGFELNPEYVLIATKRLAGTVKQVSLI